ncbi:hypothetical protein [Sorangium sp. So ce1389]|uniref:hypothetical protein n=1 Tax=Sorangium sp. So ce1389 TaxID=3133336 RepID=UPI003F615F6C
MITKTTTYRLCATMLAIALSGCGAAPADDAPGAVSLDQVYQQMDRSMEGLLRYRTASVAKHEALRSLGAQEAHATITLGAPVPPGEAADIIRAHHLDVRMLYAYALRDGEVLTIADKRPPRAKRAALDGSWPEQLDDRLKRVSEHLGAELLGVVALVGSVEADQIDLLQRDDRVFLVDVSADQHLIENPGNSEYMQSFAWDLYHRRK